MTRTTTWLRFATILVAAVWAARLAGTSGRLLVAALAIVAMLAAAAVGSGRLAVRQHTPSAIFARLLLGYVLALALAVIVPDASRPPAPGWTPIPVVLVLRWLLCTLLVWSIEPVVGALAASATFERGLASGRRHPRTVVAVAALAGTLISTYPLLFLGQSLVSPFINGTYLLYNQAPFAPGYGALASIENPRGSDVGAMMWQDVPHSSVQREALAAGEWPLWNRYNAAGRPLWGQGLTFPLDPLHWLTWITPDPALGWDLKYVAHRLVFSVGLAIVTLAATGSLSAGVVAGFSAPFVGVYTFQMSHPGVFCLTYAPWVLLAWSQLATAGSHGQRVSAAVQLAVTSALLLVASLPKEAMVTLLGVHATGAIAVLTSSGNWAARGRRFAMAGLAGVAVALVTAPHWLIFADALANSATAYDMPVVVLGGLPEAEAFFLGPLTGGALHTGLHLLALVLIVSGIMGLGSVVTHRPLFVAACGLTGFVLVALAFGALPVSWLVRIPLIRSILHINDTFPTASVPLLMVFAASGVEVLRHASTRRTTLITLGVGIVVEWLAVSLWSATTVQNVEPVSILRLGLFPLAIALPWGFRAIRAGTALLPLAVAAAVAALLLPGGLHAETANAGLNALLLQPRPRGLIEQISPAVETVHGANEPSRTVGVDYALWPGTQALYRLEGIGGADPLEVPVYRELEDAAGIRRGWYWRTDVPAVDLARLQPLLDMLNVGFLFARTDAAPPGFADVPVSGPDRLRVAGRTTAWPRAFFVESVSTYDEARGLLRDVASQAGPMAAVQSTDRQALDATHAMRTPSRLVVPATNYVLTMNTTSFSLRTPGPGIAVLSETYLPGDFRASLNGRRVDYFRVNHAFKGVVIPGGGDWRVSFEFRPRLWNVSWIAAASGLGLLVALAVSARRHPKRAR